MSNPQIHAERSVRKWGGISSDYLPIHQWFDQTKAHCADNRHRLILHNAFGIILAEQVFGVHILNSHARRVFVRDIGQQHVLEDLGFIPMLSESLANMPILPWMAGARKALNAAVAAEIPVNGDVPGY